jgi:hypothetical protein
VPLQVTGLGLGFRVYLTLTYSVGIDVQLLADSAGPAFANMLLCAPLRMLPLADEACHLVQQQLLKISSSRTLMAFKPHVHARVTHLPRTPEIIRETVSSILSRDVGHVLQVHGRGDLFSTFLKLIFGL